jgi:hypothetical protein
MIRTKFCDPCESSEESTFIIFFYFFLSDGSTFGSSLLVSLPPDPRASSRNCLLIGLGILKDRMQHL